MLQKDISFSHKVQLMQAKINLYLKLPVLQRENVEKELIQVHNFN